MSKRNPPFVERIEAAALLDAAPDAWLIVDADGLICGFNDRTPAMFGRDASELERAPVETLIPAAERGHHDELRRSYTADPSPRAMGVGLSLRAQRGDGTTFPVDISLSPIRVDGITYVIAAVRDMTEASVLREELAAVQRDAALVEDRERVARDLHDTVIQQVFAVGLSLQSLSGRSDNPTVQERLHQAIDDLDHVIRDIRTVIFGLTNHVDWGRGLKGEILRIAADESKALGFEPTIEFIGSVDEIDPVVAEQMLPTLREALSNVARHAGARRCDVTLTVANGGAELRVVDDGAGPDATNSPGGRGLPNMRARADALGGYCELIAGPVTGAQLHWSVPLEGG